MNHNRSEEPNHAVKSIIIEAGMFCRRVFPLVFVVLLVVSYSVRSLVLGLVTVLLGVAAIVVEIWYRRASRW